MTPTVESESVHRNFTDWPIINFYKQILTKEKAALMEYVRALAFVVSLLVCCVLFSAFAAIFAIANPLVLMLLFTVGIFGMFFVIEFLDSALSSYY